jgi:hypothetical protein
MDLLKNIILKLNPTTLTNPDLTNPDLENDKHSGRVDINNLLDRARKVKSDERRTSLIYTSLFILVILIVGILLSF